MNNFARRAAFESETINSVKSIRRRLRLFPLFAGLTLSLLLTRQVCAAKPLTSESFTVRTKNLVLNFEVGSDGRLYQRPVGADNSNVRPQRVEESYPQAGDGYVWEPALQATPADGNIQPALFIPSRSR